MPPAQKLDLAARIRRQDAEKDFKYYNVRRFILHPGQWNKFNAHGAVLNWQKRKFTEANAALVPKDEQGVYTFVVEPGIAGHQSVQYLVYVGMTGKQDFRTRYRQYLREPEDPKRREHIAQMIEKWKDNLWFYYAVLPSNSDIVRIEDELLAAFIPPHNRDFPAEIGATVRRVFA